MLNFITRLIDWLESYALDLFPRPSYDVNPIKLPMNQEQAPEENPTPVSPTFPIPTAYAWNTQENARHSIRVICDEEGLSFESKNEVTACIYQESQFWNIFPDGTAAVNHNWVLNPDGSLKRDGQGKKILSSTDWGLCQINDTPGWYIGPPPLPFSSVEFLMKNPEAAVRFMVSMQKAGRLSKWTSYKSGAYRQWMPYVHLPVPASGHYPHA